MRRRDVLRAGVALVGGWVVGAGAVRGGVAFPAAAGASGPLLVSAGSTLTLAPGVHSHTSVTVEPGGKLVFPSGQTCVLESSGNVVVEGDLVMKVGNSAYDKEHVLRFVDVNEANFVGGGMDPVASDVGLWVMGAGAVTAKGSVRSGWLNASGALGPGDPVPSANDWQPGDEVWVAPMSPPRKPSKNDERGHAGDFEVSTVGGVCAIAHGTATGPDNIVRTAEVINLTNNVRIEGTPGGRAHVFVRSTGWQRLQNVTLRHLGVPVGGSLDSGRYGLHFHHCGEGSRGSFVREVVARDCGSHAFVPHTSHGVTFRQCAAVETVGPAYWWDLNERTDDTTYDRCIGAGQNMDGVNTDGVWTLGEGVGNAAPGCVAVGWWKGGSDLTGFHWPSQANKGPGLWDTPDLVGHNGQGDGIFVWQNTFEPHVVDRPVMFHNARSGIDHGAYRNPYHYNGAVLWGNGLAEFAGDNAALLLHATSKQDQVSGATQEWINPLLDGEQGAAVRCLLHHNYPEQPVTFTGGVLTNDGTEALVVVDEPPEDGGPGTNPTWIDFIGTVFDRPQDDWFWLTPGRVHHETTLIVAGVCEVRPSASGVGVPHPAWGDALVVWL